MLHINPKSLSLKAHLQVTFGLNCLISILNGLNSFFGRSVQYFQCRSYWHFGWDYHCVALCRQNWTFKILVACLSSSPYWYKPECPHIFPNTFLLLYGAVSSPIKNHCYVLFYYSTCCSYILMHIFNLKLQITHSF